VHGASVKDKSLPHKVGLRTDSAPTRMHNLKLDLQINLFALEATGELSNG